jgi:thiamine-monophosphate kinase
MEELNKKLTNLSKIGEFGLIDKLTKDIVNTNKSTLKGIGDDAAVIDVSDKKILVSTDLLVEGVHFDLAYTPLKHLGYKAAVVNFSDIAAMNAIPKQITIGLALPPKFTIEACTEFFEGIKLACKNYDVDIIGGDTTSSTSDFFISVTVIGEAKENDIVYRNTAGEGDLICVTGDLGAAYMGLLLLVREKKTFLANPSAQPDLQGNDYVISRQLKPEPRLDAIKLFKDYHIKPTSMIDVSDGLASDILHICKNSDKGCRLYEEKIPVDPATALVAEEFEIASSVAALHGGEDYELLFTIKQADFQKVKDLPGISIIGHITEASAGVCLITNAGSVTNISAQGWNAFAEES